MADAAVTLTGTFPNLKLNFKIPGLKDTGWRNIYATHGVGLSGDQAVLKIRRINNTVIIVGSRLTLQAGKNVISATMPAGFKQDVLINAFDAVHTDGTSAWVGRVTLREQESPTPNKLETNMLALTNWCGFSIRYETPDIWPTVLPGTAM